MSENIKYLPIWDTVTTAWKNLYGSKRSIWAAIGISLFILASLRIIDIVTDDTANDLFLFLFSLVEAAMQYLLIAGINYLGIQRAKGLTPSLRMMTRAFQIDITIKSIGLFLLKTIIIVSIVFIPMLINIYVFWCAVPFIIYLIFRMSMALPLVLDKGYNPWQAIKSSFDMTRWNVGRLFVLYLLQSALFLLSLLTLGIAYIWTMPLLVVIYGTVYTRLLPNLRENKEPLAKFQFAKSDHTDFH